MSDADTTVALATSASTPTSASTQKKNKACSSALQKEINNMERVCKHLDSALKLSESIEELEGDDYDLLIRAARSSVTSVSNKLSSAQKSYTKDTVPSVKKTNGRIEINLTAYPAK